MSKVKLVLFLELFHMHKIFDNVIYIGDWGALIISA